MLLPTSTLVLVDADAAATTAPNAAFAAFVSHVLVVIPDQPRVRL